MSAAPRVHWIRVILGALLLEIVLLVTLVPISFVNTTLFLIAVPIGCLVFGYLVTWWILRPVTSRPVLHGALIGVVATAMYLGLVVSQPGGMSSVIAIYGVPFFWILNLLRIAGCVLGGVRRPARPSLQAV